MRRWYDSVFDRRIHFVILGDKDLDPGGEDDGSIDEYVTITPTGFRALIKQYNLEVVEEKDDAVRYESRDRVILNKLDYLLSKTTSQSEIDRGKPMDMSEAAAYLGISVRALYKLTSQRRIPFSKSQGKNYFTLEDLNRFMTADRVASMDEIKRAARDRTI